MATVLHNQSLLDFAIQHTGNVTNAFEIAKTNGLAVSDELEAGTELIIPTTVVNDVDVLQYYASRAIQPATDITLSGDEQEEQEGISIWGINNDFIVQ